MKSQRGTHRCYQGSSSSHFDNNHHLFFKPGIDIHATSDINKKNKPAITANKIPMSSAAHSGAFFKDTSRERNVMHAFDGKGGCSPTWFGDTSPEIDAKTGGFTGKLITTFNEPELKDPCVRDCVEQHEKVHVADLSGIVKRVHDCDVAAGDDWTKKEKCNEMSNKEFNGMVKKSECRAYNTSFTCLTLKLLDSKDPCSKSPHRDVIQKHRGYEACEMKKACAEAGTPEAGIPNS